MRIRGLTVIRSGFEPVGYELQRARAEQRAEGDQPDAGAEVMELRFSPFNTWYRIDSWFEGTFLERTVPGAFKRTIDHAKRADGNFSLKSLFNHGADFSIGDKLLGTVTSATERDDSPEMLVDLYDAAYVNDLKPGLRAGDYGSSFMFEVLSDKWDYEPEPADHNPDGLPERTISEVRLYEAGPVTWPANPAATAGMRSLAGSDWYVERMTARDPELTRDMIGMFEAFRAGNRLSRSSSAPGAPARHVDAARAAGALAEAKAWRSRIERTAQGHKEDLTQ